MHETVYSKFQHSNQSKTELLENEQAFCVWHLQHVRIKAYRPIEAIAEDVELFRHMYRIRGLLLLLLFL